MPSPREIDASKAIAFGHGSGSAAHRSPEHCSLIFLVGLEGTGTRKRVVDVLEPGLRCCLRSNCADFEVD